jgi:hypothetical protein
MRSRPSWTSEQLIDVLKIKQGEADGIAATLEMLGYIESVPGKKDTWKNTEAGNTVSGAKPPRFKPEKVLEAIEQLRARAEQMNSDPAAPVHVTDVVAFGDFLDELEKVQAADVGVGLTSTADHKITEDVLTNLRARSTMLHLHPYEDWMRKRSHRDV